MLASLLHWEDYSAELAGTVAVAVPDPGCRNQVAREGEVERVAVQQMVCQHCTMAGLVQLDHSQGVEDHMLDVQVYGTQTA